jgi:hypothetical protein
VRLRLACTALLAAAILAACGPQPDEMAIEDVSARLAVAIPVKADTCRLAERDGRLLARCDMDVMAMNALRKDNGFQPRDETMASRRRFEAADAPDWWGVHEGTTWIDLSRPGADTRVGADVTPGRLVRVYLTRDAR